jgi:hypothetical protein
MAVQALTADEAMALATQLFLDDAVALIAVEYNWGPPISGRFDEDFLHLYAATNGETQVGDLYLQGRGDGDQHWSINEPFQFLTTVHSPTSRFAFYALAATVFPVEFVLRLDRYDGQQRYDNNHGANYHVVPQHGRGGSALSVSLRVTDERTNTSAETRQALVQFGKIIPFQLYWASLPKAQP